MLALCCGPLALAGAAGETSIRRDFWSADHIEWGDGRPYATPVKKEGPYPQGFKADFQTRNSQDRLVRVGFHGTGTEARPAG